MEDLIGYDEIIESSMRNVIYKILKKVEKEGLQGEHYFVISFSTTYPGANISPALRVKFPEEMTVVIQHQFDSLKVEEDKFSISLSFSGHYDNLVIPYNSITSFADPSINFGLKFNSYSIEEYEELEKSQKGEIIEEKAGKKKGKKVDVSAKVVSLDAFRKNKDKK